MSKSDAPCRIWGELSSPHRGQVGTLCSDPDRACPPPPLSSLADAPCLKTKENSLLDACLAWSAASSWSVPHGSRPVGKGEQMWGAPERNPAFHPEGCASLPGP